MAVQRWQLPRKIIHASPPPPPFSHVGSPEPITFKNIPKIFPIKKENNEIVACKISLFRLYPKTDMTDLGLGFDFGFDLEEPPGDFLRIL